MCAYIWRRKSRITVPLTRFSYRQLHIFLSPDHHGVLKQPLSKIVFKLTSKLQITNPLWSEITCKLWILLTKVSNANNFSCHDPTMMNRVRWWKADTDLLFIGLKLFQETICDLIWIALGVSGWTSIVVLKLYSSIHKSTTLYRIS